MQLQCLYYNVPIWDTKYPALFSRAGKAFSKPLYHSSLPGVSALWREKYCPVCSVARDIQQILLDTQLWVKRIPFSRDSQSMKGVSTTPFGSAMPKASCLQSSPIYIFFQIRRKNIFISNIKNLIDSKEIKKQLAENIHKIFIDYSGEKIIKEICRIQKS